MKQEHNKLVGSLLKKGNTFKLKCPKCNSLSVQITENEKPDTLCFECGGKCEVLK